MNESAPACLAVIGRKVDLEGTFGSYAVDAQNGTIIGIFSNCCGEIEVPADKLPALINELTAIMRHIPELSKSNEMW